MLSETYAHVRVRWVILVVIPGLIVTLLFGLLLWPYQVYGLVGLCMVRHPETGEWEEQWTGDYIFENEWQSFRTKKDRSLELISVAHECTPGRRKLAVKVVDIFGNDTMTIVEVTV